MGPGIFGTFNQHEIIWEGEGGRGLFSGNILFIAFLFVVKPKKMRLVHEVHLKKKIISPFYGLVSTKDIL